MSRRAEFQLNTQILAKFPEVVVVKLPSIICYEYIRDPISAYNIPPDELGFSFP